MIQRLAISLIAVVLLFAAQQAQSQEASNPDPGIAKAFELFHQGKLRQAADKLRTIIAATENPTGKAWLERYLMEICATGYDWKCVGDAIDQVVPRLKADAKLGILYPDLVLYGTKLALWHGNYQYVDQFIQSGGASSAAAPVPHAALFSELALTLHGYHIKKLETVTAEQMRSSAILGLLLTEPNNSFQIAKVLFDLIEAMLDAHDIVGAFSLASDSESYLLKSINLSSELFARYRNLTGYLLSYTNALSATASNFIEAARLYEQLEMNDGIKEYRIGVAHNLAATALMLDGKLDESAALHARHPLQAHKETIFERGAFQQYTDFFFGVAEVYLSANFGKKPDPRWRRLFESEPGWQLTDLEKNDIESYRNFALGLLSMIDGAKDEGQRLLLLAAGQRIDNFEHILGANLEGFPLPGLVDRIVITVGLASAVNTGGRDSIDLMLRGSEVLGRNLRHQLVDVASLVASQPDIRSRSEAHAYVHLLAKKREWELDRIRKLMAADPSLQNKGALINDYTRAVTTIASLKEKFRSGAAPTSDSSTLERLQQSLNEGEAYVGYFPFFGRVGKICVTRGSAVYATADANPGIINDVKAFPAAVSSYPKNVGEAEQFPAPAAVRLYTFLFGGLEECLVPGTHAIVALSSDFAGVPLGALVREEPPRHGRGYDLREARWLIRDLSFSIVISARHHLAAITSVNRRLATRPFLGIGDPNLTGDRAIKISSAVFSRVSGEAKRGILHLEPLPETADEVRAAAKLFGADTVDVLLGLRGTEEAFRARPLSEYDVLHFATHGLVKEDVAGLPDSALVLTPGSGADRLDDGLLTADEISRLSLNARLVVLSACNTAKYDVTQASLGVQDLQSAFTVAGAPTLLASLWPVDSLATKDLIAGFLTEWRAPGSKGASDALGRAMRAFLARSDPLFQHPSFWAPFVVVGNGGVVGISKAGEAARPPAFEFLPGFSTFGEILHAVRTGPDLIFSMIAEWDGAKMNGVLTRRSIDGAEKWRVGSREIAGGKVVISGTALYTIGFRTSENFIPVVRSFDSSGKLRWKVELADLPYHWLSDVIATSDGLIAVAIPRLAAADVARDVLVLDLGKDGRVRRKVKIGNQGLERNVGDSALITAWNDKLAVVANSKRSFKHRAERKTFSGLPSVCWEGTPAMAVVLDARNLRVISSIPIANFTVRSLATLDGSLFLGGETGDNCSRTGVATLFRLDKSGKTQLIWKDEDLFASAVQGMAVVRGHLALAVRHERTLGIASVDAQRTEDYNSRHWGEDLATAHEASEVMITGEGRVLGTQYVAGGLGIRVQGLLPMGDRLIAYGMMGGLPAYTPALREQQAKPKKGPIARKPGGGWETKIIVGR